MTRLLLLLAACAAPAPAPLSSHVAPRSASTRHVLVGRALTTDEQIIRGTMAITIDGDRAELARWSEVTTAPLALAQLAAATWTRDGAASPVEHAAVVRSGDHLELAFPSLQLTCFPRTMRVATAGAVLRHGASCDEAVWTPARLVPLDAWACGFGAGLDDGQVEGLDGTHGSLDETLFRFADAPGIEEVDTDCVRGLRLAR